MPDCCAPRLKRVSIHGIQVSQQHDGQLLFKECEALEIPCLDFGSHRNNEYVLSQLGQTIQFQHIVDRAYIQLLLDEHFDEHFDEHVEVPTSVHWP